MSKILISSIFCYLLLSQVCFTQDKSYEKGKEVFFNYELSNSAGFSFGETKPVFYINFLKNLNQKFSIGIRSGVYAYKEKLETKLQDEYLPIYNGLNPGHYTVMFNYFEVNGLTYVLALAGKYRISNSFSFSLSGGIKNYLSTGYNATFSFDKVNNSYPFIVTIGSASETGNNKNITRAYYSVSADFTINRFTVGIFGDNIYSLGLNFGLMF